MGTKEESDASKEEPEWDKNLYRKLSHEEKMKIQKRIKVIANEEKQAGSRMKISYQKLIMGKFINGIGRSKC